MQQAATMKTLDRKGFLVAPEEGTLGKGNRWVGGGGRGATGWYIYVYRPTRHGVTSGCQANIEPSNGNFELTVSRESKHN